MINMYSCKQGTHNVVDYNNRLSFPLYHYVVNYPLVMELKDKVEQRIELSKGKKNSNNNNNDNSLLEISIKEEDYYIYPNAQDYTKAMYDQFISDKCAWLVYRKLLYPPDASLKTNQYKLHEGDIIKIGRVILLVTKIQLNSKEKAIKGKNEKENPKQEIIEIKGDDIMSLNTKCVSPNSESMLRINKSKTYSAGVPKENCTCRICFCEELDFFNDPLIRPCSCIGSLEYIHYYCLKQWLKSKMEIKSNSKPSSRSRQYLINQIECELCKAKYPDCVRLNHKLFNLLDFSEEYDIYIILESISFDQLDRRFLFIASFDKGNKMSLGRDYINDIVIADASVSHLHSVLKRNGNCVYIEDSLSKFGTLILVQSPQMKVLEGQTLSIQIGRIFIGLSIKNSSCLCCGVDEIDFSNSYSKMNSSYVRNTKSLVIKEDNNNNIIIKSDEEDNGQSTQLINIPNKRISHA